MVDEYDREFVVDKEVLGIAVIVMDEAVEAVNAVLKHTADVRHMKESI